jgi:exodeoxyribonuclease VII large subunit
MEPAGLGALYEQLKQLQAKLAKEGLFDPAHKKPLPHFPDRIAVVTSASGAVIHDIMVTANRRFPHAEIDLYPAQVQGDTAADSLIRAMQQIAAQGDKYDVMIIGRGGGSLEDLWPFNEEKVVRQVYAMPMPVISSVGHETDTTLCDLVADARAATPTAAAEYATPNTLDELAHIKQLTSQLVASMQNIIRSKRDRLSRVQNSVIMREPTRLYDQQIQQVDQLKQRLQNSMQNRVTHSAQSYQLLKQRLFSVSPDKKINQLQQQKQFLQQRMIDNMQHYLKNKRNVFTQVMQQLDDYSPLKTLERGFVYSTNEHGETISSVKQVQKDDRLLLHFKDGQVDAVVTKIKEEQNGSKEK